MNLTYKEYTPTPTLRPYVHCFWSMHADGLPHELSSIQSCFPSGMIEWITHVKGHPSIGFLEQGKFVYPQSLFTGICDKATPYAVYGQSEMFGIRLNPEAAMNLLGMDLKTFRNSHLNAKHLNDPECSTLNDQLIKASSHADRIRQVEAFLVNRINGFNNKANYLSEAMRLLRTEDAPDIKNLSKILYVGERQLQRSFQNTMGITPKFYFRVARLYRAHEMGLKNQCNFSDIAYRSGYADPAHFTRDFKEYFGVTPAAHFGQRN